MMKYKILLALLCGAGFTSLLALLLESMLAYPALIFLTPGALPVAFISRSSDFGPAAGVLIANSVLYAGLAFYLFNKASAKTIRRATLVLIAPAGILVGLACTPSLDPLWPSGMDELARVEAALNNAFPAGMSDEQARSVLKQHKIEFSEQNGEIYGRSKIGAFQFPCGYELQVQLSLDTNAKLRDHDIHRVRICP